MNKKDEIKIEVLSNIDDKIIDKQTTKRYSLMIKNKYSRKKMVGWLSVAASFVLVFSFLFAVILPLFTKQIPVYKEIPVYKGMTVSNSMPSVLNDSDNDSRPKYQLKFLNNSIHSSTLLSRGNIILLSADTSADIESETDNVLESLKESGDNRSLYYTKKNEDIYITIHINNPEEFEILSFTLNGVKYQSYMFENGSNSEQLILKINVGDAQGIIDYTIDAIKYVDGTMIKDVRMEGERTVSVGVYPENQPKSQITNWSVDYEKLRFDVVIDDPMSLIKDSNGGASVVVFDGDTILDKKELSLDQSNAIEFSNLSPGKEYVCRVIANYDAIDGQGFGVKILEEKIFKARSHVTITGITALKGQIVFELDIEDNNNVELKTIELMKSDGHLVAVGDVSTRSFDNLYAGQYCISVSYTYGIGGDKKIGYAYTSKDIVLRSLGSLENRVVYGTFGKGFSGDMQVWNETTSDYRQHTGIDILTEEDVPVYSALGGTIDRIWYDGGSMGRCISIKHDEGLYTIYKNLHETLPEGIVEGASVRAGQLIGSVGISGLEYEEGPHLHFELIIDNELVDPLAYFY